MSLPEALERAASALPAWADEIRPANGDPNLLLEALGGRPGADVLVWLLVNEPEAGAELATAWAEEPGGADTLSQVDPEALPKTARKLLRRALHDARSRGLAVREPEAPERVAKLREVEDELGGAYLSPLDPLGARVAVIVEPNPAGGARVFEIVFEEGRGIVHFEAFTASRSHTRRFTRTITRRERFSAIPAPPDAVRALVARAAGRQPASRPLPQAFLEWRSHVAGAPAGAVTPGELVRAELGGDESPARLEQAEDLVRRGEVGPWPPDEATVRAEVEKIAEAESSKIVVSEASRNERREALLEDAARRLASEAAGARTAECFEETAFVFWKGAREEEARACLAAAAAFRTAPDPASRIARAMLERVLPPLVERLRKEGSDSLVEQP